jgi:hypothetical protein
VAGGATPPGVDVVQAAAADTTTTTTKADHPLRDRAGRNRRTVAATGLWVGIVTGGLGRFSGS